MPRKTSNQLVEREFLTLPVWDRLDMQTAETVARAVERCLPGPWKFVRVAWHECGNQKRHVAFFAWYDLVEFALIPGGKVTLGYDPDQPKPPAKSLKDWQREARMTAEDSREWEGITWNKYLTDVLSPLRHVQLAPFLIMVNASRRGQQNKTGKAERKLIAKEGFRLPTADQWEFACSGGSRAVWHWGNDPSKKPPGTNAFGLVFVPNTYIAEVIDEPGHFRGGDGGVRACGGCCRLESYVPLSSWFRSYGTNKKQEDWWEATLYRRVFPLPDAMLS